MDAPASWSPFASPLPVPYGKAISGSSVLTSLGENPSPFRSPANSAAWNKIPKGGSSERVGGHENISGYWANVNNSSFSRASGYGCGPSDRFQPCSSLQVNASGHVTSGTAPPNIPRESIHLESCAAPCFTSKALGHVKNGTSPDNISGASHRAENGTLPGNILGIPAQVSGSSISPGLPSQRSGIVIGKNSGMKPLSQYPDEYYGAIDFRAGCMPPLASSCVESRGGHKGMSFAVHKEGKIELRNDTKGETETIHNQSPHLGREESAKQSIPTKGSVAQYSPPLDFSASSGGIPACAADALGSSVPMAKDIPVNGILVSLQHLSDILLSSNFGASELKDHDCELLQSVTNNLGAFIIKNNKDDSKLKETQSSIAKLRSDLAVIRSSNSRNKKEVHYLVPNLSKNELNSAEDNKKLSNLDDEEVAQAVEDTSQNKFCDNEESSQAQLYRKLWIQTESALRSLKYELQLAKIKINNREEGELQQSSEVSRLKFKRKGDRRPTELNVKDKNHMSARLTPNCKEGVYVIPTRRVIKSQSSRLSTTKAVEFTNTVPNSTTTEQNSKWGSIEVEQNGNHTMTQQRTKLEPVSSMELTTDDAFCHVVANRADIKTSMTDEDIDLCLDFSLGSTDGELESCVMKFASGDDSISSDWEHVDEV